MKNPSQSEWERWPNLIAVSLFLALIGFFYREVIFGSSIFVFVDASRFFYPLWKWGADVLSQGIIPLWNSDAQFGTPYFADPQMAYAYPPVPILYSLFSPLNAFAALIILHHLWALMGFWFFARGQGFSPKTSFLGSLIFGFSLHLVCSSWTPVALLTISWIPWIFLAADKTYENKNGGFLYLSFAWAMQFAAGYPVLTYLTGLAVGLNYFWRTFKDVGAPPRGRSLGRAQGPAPTIFPFSWLWWFAGAGLTAVAYNLVWGIPFVDLFLRSNYQNGATKFHDLGLLDLATVLNPFVQGHPLGADYHGPHYWVSTYFIGLPALCLLLWGGIYRVYRKSSVAVFFIFLVLSLGVLGLGRILKLVLPGYGLVIHSGYWISLLVLWAAWMTMETADSLLTEKGGLTADKSRMTPIEKKRRVLSAFTGDDRGRKILWIVVAVFVYGISAALGQPLLPFPFWLSLVFLGGVVIFNSTSVRWFFLVTATLISLGSAASSLNILLDQSYYDKPPEVLPWLSKGGRLYFSPPVMKEAGVLRGDSMAQAYEMAKQKLYPDWPLGFGKEQAPIYNTLQLKDSFAWTFQAFQQSQTHSRKILDYLGIHFVFGKNNFVGFKKLPIPDKTFELYENPSPMPKWFTVERAAAAGSSVEEDFTRADKAFLDYGKSAFIQDSSKTGIYQGRQVSERIRKPNLLTLGAEGKGKALLVSSETNFPGWRVWVEGKVRPLETINHAFRGVVLNEGEKTVLFYFLPATFRLGLFISLLVCGLWVGLLLKRALI